MATQKIETGLIADSAVTTAKLADNSVTAAKIAAGSLDDQVKGISSSADAVAITIDSSENVGIGTDSPSGYRLNVSKGSTGNIAQITDGIAQTFIFRSDSNTLYAGNANNFSLAFVTNNTEKMTIDASGNVGIGTDNPTADLSVGSTSTSSGDVHLRTTKTAFSITPSNTDAGGILFDLGWVNGGQGPMKFGINASEKMRIDSSGNVLISGISSSINAGSISLEAQGRIRAGRDGGAVIQLNRTTSDGDIAVFYKDGSSVGSIGTVASILGVGSGDTLLGFDAGLNAIYPMSSQTGGNSNGVIDLGYSTRNFKDLYLSGKAKAAGADFSGQVQHFAGNVSTYFRADNARYGQIFMDNNAFNIRGWTSSGEPIKINAAAAGGPILLQSASTTKVRIDGDGLKFNSDTAVANALDDYEEGTWTPSFQSDLTTTYTTRVGTYTKVGNLVTAWFHININVNGGSSSQSLIIAGLPFAAINTTENYGVVTGLHCNGFATTTKPDHALISAGGNVANLYKTQGQTGIAIPTFGDIGAGNVLGVLIYRGA